MEKRIKQLVDRYIPMTETAFYMLLALREERHGYGIMQDVEELTAGRLRIGAGTIYGTLSKMEEDGLIEGVREGKRRKTYQQTTAGKTILALEIERLEEMLRASQTGGGSDGKS